MKPVVGSYSLLNTYEICPHQAFRRYVAKDIPFVESPEMAHGNTVHNGMEMRLKRGTVAYPEYEKFAAPLAAQGAEAELKFGITAAGKPVDFFGEGVWFRGKIDVVTVQGSFGFIADWKTGKVRENPDEIQIFGLMTKIRKPALERISGAYIWLKEQKIGKVYDLSDFAATWTRLKARMDAVHDSQAREWWPKTQGPLCSWCSVTDCEFNRRGK